MPFGLANAAHALESRRRAARNSRKPFVIRRPLAQLAPRGLEREYAKALLRIVRRLTDLTRDRVFPKLAGIVRESDAEKPIRRDQETAADLVAELMRATTLWFDDAFTAREMDTLAEEIAWQISGFNKVQVNKVFRSVLSVDVVHSEPWLPAQIKAFTHRNVALIKDLKDSTYKRIEGTVFRGMSSGLRQEEIASKLEDGFGFSESRAKLIGRDQTNKFNGELTHLRQEEAGIKSYIWRTAMDERVRESHQELEDTQHDWDDPPDEGHPGEPINCFPESEVVSLGSYPLKAFRRWYEGELTEIRADGLAPIRLTPNHPLLTQKGWVPAKDLQLSDYLIETSDQLLDGPIPYPEGRNSKAGDLFVALKKRGLLRKTPFRAARFHGDLSNQDVHVVELDRFLQFKRIASFPKKIRENLFTISDKSALCFRSLSAFLVTYNPSAYGIVGGGGPGASLRLGGAFHPSKHGGSPPAWLYPIREKDSSNRKTPDPELLSDSQLAESAFVQRNDLRFRKIKSVVRYPWAGWVHNFETTSGWYRNKGIIVHNCRCWAEPVFDNLLDE